MYICKEVLSKDEVKDLLDKVKALKWNEGVTNLNKEHKNNEELTEEALSTFVANKITAHPTVFQKALLKYMAVPRFNRYENNGHYSKHVDFFKQQGIRTDWSMTLFLTEPDTYEGGELVISDLAHEPLEFKLDAGDMVLYPSGLIHHVNPVTKGDRIAVISWAQSEIEDFKERDLVTKLGDVLKTLEESSEDHKSNIVNLTAVQTGLLKKWSK